MKYYEKIRVAYEEAKQTYAEQLAEIKEWDEERRIRTYRHLCLTDTYFLLRYALNIGNGIMNHPFAYAQCRFVDDIDFNQGGLDGWLFLWFREGFKSSILNIGKNIQRTLGHPEEATLIVSNTNPGAKMFLSDIKQNFEKSENLKKWFPDVLWSDEERKKPSVKWSEDAITVKRQFARKEPSIFTTGLVDGSMEKIHCENICYDDPVTETSVETQHMIDKTTKAFQLTTSLGKNLDIAGHESRSWGLGTRYADGDTWGWAVESGQWKVSLITCYDEDDRPRAHTPEKLEQIKGKMSYYNFSTQYLLDPVPAEDRKFRTEIQYYDGEPDPNWDYVLLCDPAGEGKKTRDHKRTDFSAMAVIGRDFLGNEYFVDGVYDRIGLEERIRKMFDFVYQYRIGKVWYEKVGMQSDHEIIRSKMAEWGVRGFALNAFNPRAHGPKQDRIERALMPRIEHGALKFPHSVEYVNADNECVDLIKVIRDEMRRFPRGEYDDMLDCLAQLKAVPRYGGKPKAPDKEYDYALDRKPRNPQKGSREEQTELCI